ncbi:MAG TPA: thioredoxin family protein [Chitinophagaceae bacterium]|nr:thioredoxin family protein [Chitinophagaceae bacterium]
MEQFKVDALPVFIIFKNGQQVWRKQGVVSAEELKLALTK